jgi:hypothetical protein
VTIAAIAKEMARVIRRFVVVFIVLSKGFNVLRWVEL